MTTHRHRCPNCGKYQAIESNGFCSRTMQVDEWRYGVIAIFCNEQCADKYYAKHGINDFDSAYERHELGEDMGITI